LFQKAERHLLAAKAKAIAKAKVDTDTDTDTDANAKDNVKADDKPPNLEMIDLVRRALINLYQTDGLPLITGQLDNTVPITRPTVSFATVNEYADRTTDPDEVDDTRNFTSEALFAESAQRLNRRLTDQELRALVRTKPQFDTFNRLRYRPSDATGVGQLFSAIDVFARYRHIDDAQVTSFFAPTENNDLDLIEFGVGAEKSFTPFDGEWDAFIRGGYKHIRREGLIEFDAEAEESIEHFEVNLAASHFIGPDKLTLEGVYVYQDIDPDVANTSNRDRQIAGATLSYLIGNASRNNSHFATRGQNLFAGLLYDRDSFGDVDIEKWDYFVGYSIRGFGSDDAFDVTIQPTVFTSSVDNDSSQDNAQYRTNFSFVWRIRDEEKFTGHDVCSTSKLCMAFMHLTIPVRHDVAIDGPDSFENFSVGAELSTKAYVLTDSGGPSFLLSARYDYQDFYEINKTQQQFVIRLSMGF